MSPQMERWHINNTTSSTITHINSTRFSVHDGEYSRELNELDNVNTTAIFLHKKRIENYRKHKVNSPTRQPI